MTDYNTNTSLIINNNTPQKKLEGTVFINYLNALLNPIQEAHDTFIQDWLQDYMKRYYASSVTIVLESLINELLEIDTAYIETNIIESGVFFTLSSSDPECIYFTTEIDSECVYINTTIPDFGLSNFIVYIPDTFESATSENIEIRKRLKALVDKYVIAGKVYVISYF